MMFILSFNGTPLAVAPPPMDPRMSLRCTPTFSSTSGPFEPSPGYGPAVSEFISVSSVEGAAVALDAVELVAALVAEDEDEAAPV